MKQTITLTSILLLLFVATNTYAQCPAGQTEVRVNVTTDGYGQEGYWDLDTTGVACGVNTLQWGGNQTQVGCNGGGTPITSTSGNGYASSTIISNGPWCYATNAAYDIHYIDDYGDGGFEFNVLINGFPMYNFTGSAANQTFKFINKQPPTFDLAVTKIPMAMYGQQGNKTIEGTIFNYGAATITSFDLNYTINGGTPVTQTISGLNIAGYTSYQFSHPILWNANANGSFNIDVWATNLNGSYVDSNLTNDHKIFTIIIGDATPNIIDDYTHATPTFTTIANSSNGIALPRDLDFHPVLSRNELWLVLQSTEAIGGKTAKISNAGLTGQNVLVQKDGNAWHFMSMPTGVAFSDNGNFCTSPGVLDANHGSGHFTGPALWSSVSSIYAKPSGGNGSHLDMLHQCPYAMGVAWEVDNVFWIYDGYNQDLMRCDFGNDHGPGNSDHSDGKIRSYDDIPVTYNNLNIPCHIVLDSNKKWLYIVDGGTQKVMRMDITTGTQTGTFTPYAEPLAEHSIYTGTNNSTYVSTGLGQPSGIDIIGNRLIVSDYTSGDIIIYNCSGATGVEIGRIKTMTPGVQGVKIGPDGKIWYVNYQTNEVVRIDYTLWQVGITEVTKPTLNFYPNPANDELYIRVSQFNSTSTIKIKNIVGQEIINEKLTSENSKINVSNFNAGIYLLQYEINGIAITQKFVKN
ncbi:MAG: hypothetical protein RIQ33_1535 [Bacteroidota bacterium]|jgi:hypothetical protein